MAFLDITDRTRRSIKPKHKLSVIDGGKPSARVKLKNADLALTHKIASGDRGAMKEVYDLYSGPLFHFVKNWLADPHEASDVVQETMLEVWRRADRFQGRSSLKSWIFSIARNKSIDKNRKSSRMSYTDELPEMTSDELSPIAALEMAQNSELLKACIKTLSESHRRVIHLAFFEDLSYQEISDIENCPVGTVKTRILHAKKLLMRELKRRSGDF